MAMSPWVTWPALTKFGSLGVMAALLVLAGERSELLENNMFDTENWDEKNAGITCDERSLTPVPKTEPVTSWKTRQKGPCT